MQVYGYLTKLAVVIWIWVALAGAAAAGTTEIEECIDIGLTRALAGENIARYLAIGSISAGIVGRGNWEILGKSGARESFKDLVLAVITARLNERGGEFIGAETAISSAELRQNGLYEIEGTLTTKNAVPYNFTGFVQVMQSRCVAHTLTVENWFTLSNWLADDARINEFMIAHKLKQ